MKKEYRKPDIVFEDFALTANIAGDCAKEAGGLSLLADEDSCDMYGTKADGNSCYFYDNGYTVFSSALISCDVTPQDDYDGDPDTYFHLCYHVPDGGIKMFNS